MNTLSVQGIPGNKGEKGEPGLNGNIGDPGKKVSVFNSQSPTVHV